jgi:hypothetical protein
MLVSSTQQDLQDPTGGAGSMHAGTCFAGWLHASQQLPHCTSHLLGLGLHACADGAPQHISDAVQQLRQVIDLRRSCSQDNTMQSDGW